MPPASELADLDRAAACFREVTEGSTIAELKDVAQMMLEMTDALRSIMGSLGGGPAGLDLGRMMQALEGMQNLQQRMQQRSAVPIGALPNIFAASTFAQADPFDRPVPVMEVPVPRSTEPVEPVTPARPTVPAATLRADFHRVLPDADPSGIGRLLDAGGAPLSVPSVDRLVAIGGLLVDAPDAEGTDHFLFALALYLRSRVDDSGWGADDEGGETDNGDGDRAPRGRRCSRRPARSSERMPRPSRSPCTWPRSSTASSRPPGSPARLGEAFAPAAAALARVGADALLYPAADGHLLLAASGGGFRVSDTLPHRVIVAGVATAAVDSPVVSCVASAAQLITLADRTRLPATERAAVVANPRGDRPRASFDAMMLRRRF